MTKSRIVLSKIDCSSPARDHDRPLDLHRTSARLEPEKNTSGNSRSRSTADEQTSRLREGVKEKLQRKPIFAGGATLRSSAPKGDACFQPNDEED